MGEADELGCRRSDNQPGASVAGGEDRLVSGIEWVGWPGGTDDLARRISDGPSHRWQEDNSSCLYFGSGIHRLDSSSRNVIFGQELTPADLSLVGNLTLVHSDGDARPEYRAKEGDRNRNGVTLVSVGSDLELHAPALSDTIRISEPVAPRGIALLEPVTITAPEVIASAVLPPIPEISVPAPLTPPAPPEMPTLAAPNPTDREKMAPAEVPDPDRSPRVVDRLPPAPPPHQLIVATPGHLIRSIDERLPGTASPRDLRDVSGPQGLPGEPTPVVVPPPQSPPGARITIAQPVHTVGDRRVVFGLEPVHAGRARQFAEDGRGRAVDFRQVEKAPKFTADLKAQLQSRLGEDKRGQSEGVAKGGPEHLRKLVAGAKRWAVEAFLLPPRSRTGQPTEPNPEVSVAKKPASGTLRAEQANHHTDGRSLVLVKSGDPAAPAVGSARVIESAHPVATGVDNIGAPNQPSTLRTVQSTARTDHLRQQVALPAEAAELVLWPRRKDWISEPVTAGTWRVGKPVGADELVPGDNGKAKAKETESMFSVGLTSAARASVTGVELDRMPRSLQLTTEFSANGDSSFTLMRNRTNGAENLMLGKLPVAAQAGSVVELPVHVVPNTVRDERHERAAGGGRSVGSSLQPADQVAQANRLELADQTEIISPQVESVIRTDEPDVSVDGGEDFPASIADRSHSTLGKTPLLRGKNLLVNSSARSALARVSAPVQLMAMREKTHLLPKLEVVSLAVMRTSAAHFETAAKPLENSEAASLLAGVDRAASSSRLANWTDAKDVPKTRSGSDDETARLAKSASVNMDGHGVTGGAKVRITYVRFGNRVVILDRNLVLANTQTDKETVYWLPQSAAMSGAAAAALVGARRWRKRRGKGPTSNGLPRDINNTDQEEPSEPTRDVCLSGQSRDARSTVARLVSRFSYMVQPADTLSDLAWAIWQDRDLAWLILEVNGLAHEWEGDRCMVTLAARQLIDFPTPDEVTEFYKTGRNKLNRHKQLFTIVKHSQIDDQLLTCF